MARSVRKSWRLLSILLAFFKTFKPKSDKISVSQSSLLYFLYDTERLDRFYKLSNKRKIGHETG